MIADGLPDVSVCFADLVHVTQRSQRTALDQVVQFLNDVFTAFDRLAAGYGLEKIKTGRRLHGGWRAARPAARPRAGGTGPRDSR